MRKTFDAELQELNAEMIDMAAAAEDVIDAVTQSLTSADHDAAKGAVEMTKHMDQMERDIENRCLRLLLQQQPEGERCCFSGHIAFLPCECFHSSVLPEKIPYGSSGRTSPDLCYVQKTGVPPEQPHFAAGRFPGTIQESCTHRGRRGSAISLSSSILLRL